MLQKNKNKRPVILKIQLNVLLNIIILSIVSLFTSPSLANYYDNDRADAIYRVFEQSNSKGQQETDSLLEEYKQLIANDDHVRQQIYVRLNCWNKKSDTNQELAQNIEYAQQQLIIYAEPYPSEINTDLLLCISHYKQLSGQLDEAYQGLSTAIKNAYQIENPKLIADGRSIRGAILSYQGNYSAALEDLITAQHLYEKINDTYWANENLNQLATSYRRFGDAETALKYQIKLEQTYHDAGRHLEAERVNIQIAFSLEELDRIDESTQRYKKSLAYWQAKKDKVAIADTQVNLAGNYIKQGKIDQALILLSQAEPHVPLQNNSTYSFMSLFFSKAYLAKKDYDKALKYSQQAIKNLKKDGNKRGQAQSLQVQSDIYFAKGDIENAYHTLTAFIRIHLTLDKQNISDRNAEMQARFDTDKVLNENELLLKSGKDKELQLQIMQRNDSMQIVIIALVAIILIIVSVYAYKQVKRKRTFQTLALTDELTGLSNRRDTYNQGSHFIQQAKLSRKPFSIISFDADHFKQVNDTLGHDVGDKVLVKLAAITMAMMRENDVVGRVGGEEFLVLLPNISHSQAVEIAQRLINNIATYDWSQISSGLHQTVSAGVASLENETTLSPLLLKADHALYSAKTDGRNCVRSA